MTAKEFLQEEYTDHNNWKHYPPSEETVAAWMEAYAQEKQREFIEKHKDKIWFGVNFTCEEDCNCHAECHKADEYIESIQT